MTIQEARTLVDYHYWARDRLLDALGQLTHDQFTQRIESSFPSIRDTLVHLWAAETVWTARWDDEAPTALPDGRELTDLPALRDAWSALERRLHGVLDRLGEQGVLGELQYRGFDGKPRTEPFSMMLQHVVNHGSYHRGQITMMLRQMGQPAAKPMDLIAFYRDASPLCT
jgi:uncharacterized damage-inducible protein DinB